MGLIVQLNFAPDVLEHARATVLAILDSQTISSQQVDVLALMEVRRPGHEPFRAHVRGLLSPSQAKEMHIGSTTAVYLKESQPINTDPT